MPGAEGPILVVEDEPNIRELLREALEEDGFSVATASDGEEAIRLAQAQCPAAVVLDMGLPMTDGAIVASRIREACGEGIPFVVVTATRRIEDVTKHVRAARYLTKPFAISDLVKAVRGAIDPPWPAVLDDPAPSPAS